MAYRGADPTAVMGVRIGAYLLDGLVALVVLGALAFALFNAALESAPGGTVTCPRDGTRQVGEPVYCAEDSASEVRYLTEDGAEGLQTDLVLASLLLTVVNSILLQGLVGGSVGKLILGLRVVRSDGSDAGIGRCLVRTVLLIVDGFACSIVGLVTAFNSRAHRRVGDMVAGTMVISRRDQDALILARSGIALPDRSTLAAASFSSAPGAPAAGSPLGGPLGMSVGVPVAPGAGAVAGTDGPTWDPARGAYVQYDPGSGRWVQWDDVASTWHPVS